MHLAAAFVLILGGAMMMGIAWHDQIEAAWHVLWSAQGTLGA